MDSMTEQKDGEQTYDAKSAMIGRLPRKDGNEFKSATIKLFDIDSPHKTTEFPKHDLEYENIEKVRVRGLNPTYYLEGNDVVLNDLSKLTVTKKGTMLTLHGEQEDVEKRDN